MFQRIVLGIGIRGVHGRGLDFGREATCRLTMNSPPRISDALKEVPIEVLPPDPSNLSAHVPAVEGPPIHALSALLLVAVDSLWAVFDLAPPIWIITIP